MLLFIACLVDVKFYVIIVQKKFRLEVNVKNVMNIFVKHLELLNKIFNKMCFLYIIFFSCSFRFVKIVFIGILLKLFSKKSKSE